MTKPALGQPVRYVLANGEHRAATVVNVPPPDSHPESMCNLTVHLDQWEDLDGGMPKYGILPKNARYMTAGGTLAVSHAIQDEDTKMPGTWHQLEQGAMYTRSIV